MPELKKYIAYGVVVLVALVLGRWYSIERDKLLSRGEPWFKSWGTIPGLTIIIILVVLIAIKIKLG